MAKGVTSGAFRRAEPPAGRRQLKAVDFFAGCGGFTEGAKRAGVHVTMAINHSPVAVRCHELNHPPPETITLCEDLMRFNPRKLGQFDILVASPACQGHSDARGVARGSKSDAKWDETRATAWCVSETAEIMRPDAIVVENVPKFLKWVCFDLWLETFHRFGYRTKVNIVNSADYECGQDRERVLITMIYQGDAPAIVAPKGVRRVTARDVIDLDAGKWTRVRDHVAKTVARAERGRARFGDQFVMPYYGSGSGLTGRSMDDPIGALTTRARWAVVNGDRMRMVSVDEARQFMKFRKDYELPASIKEANHLLGNAIVVDVAEAGVRAVAEVIA